VIPEKSNSQEETLNRYFLKRVKQRKFLSGNQRQLPSLMVQPHLPNLREHFRLSDCVCLFTNNKTNV